MTRPGAPFLFGLTAAMLSGAMLSAAVPAAAQNITAPPAPVPPGITVETVKVHGASLEGNLEKNSADRDVMVILPASYAKNKAKRYPVVYFLHGFAITGKDFANYFHVPEAVAHNEAKGAEFIVVVPDTLTKFGGSMYSSSVTTGDFRRFIATDLVSYIDSHYRTVARREGRGLAGHSMGGYGTWMVGMRYAPVFSSIYAMSACCVSPRSETIESAQKMAAIPVDQGVKADFGTRAGLSSAVAWAPNPKNPPYYVDFPVSNGALDPLVLAKWAANSPLANVASHVGDLRSFTAIGADVGDKDTLLADDTAIHDELTKFGIRHDWAVYPGNHVSGVGQRFDTVVLPFFASHLAKK